MIGLMVGMARFILEFAFEDPPCAKKHLDRRFSIVSKFHFLHFAILLFLITLFSAYIISIFTEPIPDKYVNSSLTELIKILDLIRFFIFFR